MEVYVESILNNFSDKKRVFKNDEFVETIKCIRKIKYF